ncbi:MAG TPA: lipoprotein, partial [Labilithrix sp.]
MKKIIFGFVPVVLVAACSSSSSTPAPTTGDTSAAVSGPADTHCNGKDSVKVDPNVCHMVVQDDAGGGDDAGDDGGGGGMDMSDYGP